MFRWKGIIFLGVLIALVVVLSFVFTDSWLENQLEDMGSSVVGAKVEIDGLDFSLSGVHLKWQRLQVTDPKRTKKNMIETGPVDIDLEFWPLLSKKVIVDNFRINDIKTYTDRATDGKLDKPKDGKSSQPGFVTKTVDKLSDKARSSASVQFSGYQKKMNVDSLLSLLNLQSIVKIDSLQKEITTRYSDWDKKLAALDIKDDVKEIEQKLKTIDPKKIKKLDQLQKALKTADELKKSVKTLTTELKTTKKDLLGDIDQARKGLAKVDEWIDDDYKTARSMAKLPELSSQNIGQIIFGEQVVGQFNEYLGYAGTARHYASKIKSDKPEKEDPPRLKGQDIYFFNKNARPDFWIKQIDLSGETHDQLKIQGTIVNIVSDQRFIGKTTDIDLSGKKDDGAQLSLTGVLDYLGETGQEKFDLNYSGFSLAHTKLSDSELLPNQVEKGSGSIVANLTLNDEQIKSKINFRAAKLVFDYGSVEKSQTYFEKIIQDMVRQIKELNFSAVIKGSQDDLVFSLSSDIDELFAKNLKATLNKEIERAKKQIQAKIDKEVSKYKDELNKVVREKEGQLRAELAKYEKQVDDQVAKVDKKKKEVEKKIEKEKKKLGKDATKKLKNLFK